MMTRTVKRWMTLVVTIGIAICSYHMSAQVINLSDTSIVSCSGTLYDSGGPNAPYSNNEFLVMSVEAGGIVTVTFGSFSLHNGGDTLFIYDSADGTGSPFVLTGNAIPAPITLFSGSFTVVMQSDSTFISSGFLMNWNSEVPLPAAPNISIGTTPACNAAQLSLQLQPPLSCSILESANATILYGDTSLQVSGINTNCVGNTSGFITLNLSEALSNKCQYIVQLHLQLPDACGNLRDVISETTFDFNTTCPLDAQILTSQNQVCAGSCIELTTNVNTCHPLVYSWNYGIPATAGPHVFCPDSTSTIQLTVTDLTTLEVVTEQIIITVAPNSILSAPEEICQNSPAIDLLTSTNGSWTGPGIQGNTFNPSVSGPGEIELFFEGPNCIESIVYTVKAISLQNQAACPNAPAFSILASPAGGVWSGDVPSTGIFPPSLAGNYNVSYEVNGCLAEATIAVANLDLTSNIDTVCQSVEVVELTAIPPGGLWSGAGVISASGIFRPELANANLANTVTYTAAGCSSNIAIFVVGANVDSLVSVCPSQSPLIPDATPIPPGGVWTSPYGVILDPSSGLINPAVLEGLTDAFMVYVPGNGCFDTLSLQISVTDIPQDYIGACFGDDPLQLDNTLFPGLSPANGIWTGTGVTGNAINGFDLNVASLTQGEYDITYSANGCTDTFTLGVWLNNLPNPTISLCVGDSAQELIPGLFCNTCSGPQASWQGTGIIDNTLGIFNPQISGAGQFYPVWSNPGGCVDSVLVTVVEPELPVISGLQENYCSGNQLVNYSASPSGGQLVGDLFSFQFNVQSLSPGSYEVIYVTQSNCASSDADSATFTFNVSPALSVSMEATGSPACYGDPISAVATATGGVPGGQIQYSWNYSPSNQSIITFNAEEDITLIVTVDDGCSGSVSAQTDIETSEEIVFEIESSDTLCKGEAGYLRLIVDPNASYNVLWNNLPELDNQVDAPAGTPYTITVTDVYGCRKDSAVTVPAFTTGIASMALENSAECLLFEERNNVKFLDLSVDAISGVWDFGDSTSQDYLPGVGAVHSYPDAGYYTARLFVESINGCSTVDTLVICIQPSEPIFIPDIFSPNSDGKNDTLYVRGFQIKRMDFKVFNRWGEQVFFTDNPTIGWAGDHRGMPAASGSYFYQLMVVIGEREKILRTGEIILVR